MLRGVLQESVEEKMPDADFGYIKDTVHIKSESDEGINFVKDKSSCIFLQINQQLNCNLTNFYRPGLLSLAETI